MAPHVVSTVNAPTTTTTKPFQIRNPEKQKKQPPLLTPLGEQRLRDTKYQILAEYKQCQRTPPPRSNIPNSQRTALSKVRKRKDLVIKPSDKDKQFVIAPKSLYIQHVNEMLEDANTYKEVTNNPLPSMTNDIESLCDTLTQKYANLADAEPYRPRLPELYCSYKTHKQSDPPPLRPVTSQVNSPAERLGHVANHILQQAMNFIPVNLQDSTQLRNRLSAYKVKTNDILATADVKSLYYQRTITI